MLSSQNTRQGEQQSRIKQQKMVDTSLLDMNEQIVRQYHHRSVERIFNQMDTNDILTKMDQILNMKPRIQSKDNIMIMNHKGIQGIKSIGYGKISNRQKYHALFNWHHKCLQELRNMLKNNEISVFESIQKQQTIMMMSMQKFTDFLTQQCDQKGLLMRTFVHQHVNLHFGLTQFMTKKLQKNLAQRIQAQNTIQKNFDEQTKKLKQQLLSLSQEKDKKWKNLFMLIKDNRILRRTKGKLMRELQNQINKQRNLRQNLIELAKQNQRYKLMFQSSDYDQQSIKRWMDNWMGLLKIQKFMQKQPLKAKRVLQFELQNLSIRQMQTLPQKVEYIIKALQQAQELVDYHEDLIDFFEPCKLLLNGFCQTENQNQEKSTNTEIHRYTNTFCQTKTNQLLKNNLKINSNKYNIKIQSKDLQKQKNKKESLINNMNINKLTKRVTTQLNKNDRFSSTFSNFGNLNTNFLRIVKSFQETIIPKYIPIPIENDIVSRKSQRKSDLSQNSMQKKPKVSSLYPNYFYCDSSFKSKLGIFLKEMDITINGNSGFIIANTKLPKPSKVSKISTRQRERFSINTQTTQSQAQTNEVQEIVEPIKPIQPIQIEHHPVSNKSKTKYSHAQGQQSLMEAAIQQKSQNKKRYSQNPGNLMQNKLKRVSNIGMVSYSGFGQKKDDKQEGWKKKGIGQYDQRNSFGLEGRISEQVSQGSESENESKQKSHQKLNSSQLSPLHEQKQEQKAISELYKPKINTTKKSFEVNETTQDQINQNKKKIKPLQRRSTAYFESRIKTQPSQSNTNTNNFNLKSNKNNKINLSKITRESIKQQNSNQKQNKNNKIKQIKIIQRFSQNIFSKQNKQKIINKNKQIHCQQKTEKNESLFAIQAIKMKQKINKIFNISDQQQQQNTNNNNNNVEIINKKKVHKNSIENKKKKLQKINENNNKIYHKPHLQSIIFRSSSSTLRNHSKKIDSFKPINQAFQKHQENSDSSSDDSVQHNDQDRRSSSFVSKPKKRITPKVLVSQSHSYLVQYQPESQPLDASKLVSKMSHLIYMNRNQLKQSSKTLRQYIEPNLKNLYGFGPQSQYQSFNKSLSLLGSDSSPPNPHVQVFFRMLNYSAPHSYQVDLLRIYIMLMDKCGQSMLADVETANWMISQVTMLFYDGWKYNEMVKQMQKQIIYVNLGTNQEYDQKQKYRKSEDILAKTSPQSFTSRLNSSTTFIQINLLHFFLMLETKLHQNCLQTQLYKFCHDILPSNETDLSFGQIKQLLSFMPVNTQFQIHMGRLQYFSLGEKDRERFLAGDRIKNSKVSGIKLHRVSLYCARQQWDPIVNIITTIQEQFKSKRNQMYNCEQMIELFNEWDKSSPNYVKTQCPWIYGLAKNSIRSYKNYGVKLNKHLLMLIYLIQINIKIQRMNIMPNNFDIINQRIKKIVVKNQLVDFLTGKNKDGNEEMNKMNKMKQGKQKGLQNNVGLSQQHILKSLAHI